MNKSELEDVNMEEEWKDIEGFEGLYQISNFGRVKSLNYRRTGKERILKPYKNNCGCATVLLTKNNKASTYSVEKLVKEHFMEHTPSYTKKETKSDFLTARLNTSEIQLIEKYMEINKIKNKSTLVRVLINNLKNEMEENK